MKLRHEVKSGVSCAFCEKDVPEATMIASDSSTCLSHWWHLQCVGLNGVRAQLKL